MAIIRNQEIKKMSVEDVNEKIKDLRMELTKGRLNTAKGGKNKIREIKKTIARLLTFNRLKRSVEAK